MLRLFILVLINSFSIYLSAQSHLYEVYQAVQEQSQAALQKKNYTMAIATLENFIKQHPRYSLAYLEQSTYAIKNRDAILLKRNIIALKAQQKMVPLDLLLTGAQLAEKKRLYQLGLEILDQSTPAQAKSEAILLQRIHFLQKLNKETKAFEILQQAYKNSPRSNKILHKLAEAYQNINRKRSIQLYELLMKEKGYEDLSLTALGLLYTNLYEADPSVNNQNNLIKAKTYYQQYLLRHPNDKNIKKLLAQLNILLQ